MSKGANLSHDLTPAEFATKWGGSTRTERGASQEHFIDLCRMLGVPTPNEADPTGDTYAFEKGAGKIEGGDGFADVWKRGHFAWEYKGKKKDLKAAYNQLLQYREALDNPPLLVVCDLDRFRSHTTTQEVAVSDRQDRGGESAALGKRDLAFVVVALFVATLLAAHDMTINPGDRRRGQPRRCHSRPLTTKL